MQGDILKPSKELRCPARSAHVPAIPPIMLVVFTKSAVKGYYGFVFYQLCRIMPPVVMYNRIFKK